MFKRSLLRKIRLSAGDHLASILTIASLATGAAMSASAQSRRPGMGSTPYEGGTTFRVWAPNASRVGVAGDFNGWIPALGPLAPEGDGLWSNDIDGAAPGDEYRYIIESAEFGVVTRRDPYGRLVTSSDYDDGNTIIYDASAFDWRSSHRFTPPERRDLIIYEMHPGTFVDRPGGGPGNFNTALMAVDYLQDLGVTAIEVLPVAEFLGRYSGGYNPADLFAVENGGYGGPDAFKVFVKACHERDIAVILDVVYNHWGPWDVATHRFDGWWSPQWPGGIYFYDEARIDSPWGPRPNYSEPRVRRYIFDNLRMWLDEYRVDGFRWDATAAIYDTEGLNGRRLPDGWSLLRQANAAMERAYPDAIRIAEDIWGGDRITTPVEHGGAGFEAQWHHFAAQIRPELIRTDDADRDMNRVRYGLRNTYNDDYSQRIIYTESHNEICCGAERLTVAIAPDDPDGWAARKRSTLGACLLFTAPGIPMIYQGQEFLDHHPFEPRQPIDWLQLRRYPGVHRLYRDLIALRLNRTGDTAGLRGGGLNVHHTNNEAKVIAYHRWDAGGAGDDVIVIANFAREPLRDYQIGLPAEGEWRVRLNSDSTQYGADYANVGAESIDASGPPRDGMPTSAAVTVGGYSAIVLSQE